MIESETAEHRAIEPRARQRLRDRLLQAHRVAAIGTWLRGSRNQDATSVEAAAAQFLEEISFAGRPEWRDERIGFHDQCRRLVRYSVVPNIGERVLLEADEILHVA